MSLGRCGKTLSASTLRILLSQRVSSLLVPLLDQTCFVLFVVRVQLRSPGFHLGAGLRATVRAKISAVSSYLHMFGAWFPPLTNQDTTSIIWNSCKVGEPRWGGYDAESLCLAH